MRDSVNLSVRIALDGRSRWVGTVYTLARDLEYDEPVTMNLKATASVLTITEWYPYASAYSPSTCSCIAHEF